MLTLPAASLRPLSPPLHTQQPGVATWVSCPVCRPHSVSDARCISGPEVMDPLSLEVTPVPQTSSYHNVITTFSVYLIRPSSGSVRLEFRSPDMKPELSSCCHMTQNPHLPRDGSETLDTFLTFPPPENEDNSAFSWGPMRIKSVSPCRILGTWSEQKSTG